MMTLNTRSLLHEDWSILKRGGKLFVWKKTIGRGNDAKGFLFPKIIVLSPAVAEAIGLYLGDGKLTDNDLHHAQFHNKDFDLIQKMYQFFLKIGVKKSDITFTLTFNSRGIQTAKRNAKTIMKKIRIVRSQRHRYPAYSLQVNGLVFRIFLKKLILSSLIHIKRHTKLRKSFLRGYFAAEGWIGYQSTEHYLANVGFAYNPKTEAWLRDFCIACLKSEGVSTQIKIRHQEHNGQIVLTNWKNYYRLWKLGVFDGCKRKREKFMSILLNTKICCHIKAPLRNQLFHGSQHKIARILQTYQATISNMKTGNKRNMWPTVSQVKKLSKLNRIRIKNIKENITEIRFGNTTILKANKELLNDVFSLR